MKKPLAYTLYRLLSRKRYSIATAESCTGGMIAAAITAIPGISAHFYAGYVVYANEAKTRMLGVPRSLLARYGAVSAPTVRAMALNAAARSGADCAIAASGIAGPGGGSAAKPVGTVYIGIVFRGRCTVYRRQFGGGRNTVRRLARNAALRYAIRAIAGKR